MARDNEFPDGCAYLVVGFTLCWMIFICILLYMLVSWVTSK